MESSGPPHHGLSSCGPWTHPWELGLWRLTELLFEVALKARKRTCELPHFNTSLNELDLCACFNTNLTLGYPVLKLLNPYQHHPMLALCYRFKPPSTFQCFEFSGRWEKTTWRCTPLGRAKIGPDSLRGIAPADIALHRQLVLVDEIHFSPAGGDKPLQGVIDQPPIPSGAGYCPSTSRGKGAQLAYSCLLRTCSPQERPGHHKTVVPQPTAQMAGVQTGNKVRTKSGSSR